MLLSSTVCVTCLLYVQVELQSLMAIADVDGDGLIDYNEFVAATMHVSKLEKEELLQKVCWLCSHLLQLTLQAIRSMVFCITRTSSRLSLMVARQHK
jgi:hypothetical protein